MIIVVSKDFLTRHVVLCVFKLIRLRPVLKAEFSGHSLYVYASPVCLWLVPVKRLSIMVVKDLNLDPFQLSGLHV